MRKSNFILVVLTIGLFGSCKSSEPHTEYQTIEHKGVKDMRITEIAIDTIAMDASATSLEGKWMLYDGKLYFSDYNLVAIQEYDLDGNFIRRHLNKGRGPKEWVSPFVSVCFDDFGNLVTIDRNWMLNRFDSLDNKMDSSFHFLSDIKYSDSDWDQLLKNPDVNNFHMYEFNLDSKGVAMLGERLVMPVVTEHVNYNGFNVNSSANDFWRNSYHFMLIDINNRKPEYLFGHYPDIYSKRNIPVFSTFSFDVSDDDQLITSYAADSLIYVRNSKGDLLHSFGYNVDGIDSDYPETTTFDNYSEVLKKHREEYGYYTDIKVVGAYVFRGYKLKKDNGYGFQIYLNNDLIGQVQTKEKMSILGNHGNVFYGALSTDIENERFNLIRFKF